MRLIEFSAYNYKPDAILSESLKLEQFNPKLLNVTNLDLSDPKILKAIKSAWLHYKNTQNNTVIFAAKDNEFIGFIKINLTSKSVAKIAIVQEEQGQRVGDELLLSAISLFLSSGVKTISISASPGAEKFYDRFFSETNSLRDKNEKYQLSVTRTASSPNVLYTVKIY